MATRIVAPGGANSSRVYALIAVIAAALTTAVAFGALEEVAARRIVKDCLQRKTFTVGGQTFDCKLQGSAA